MSPQKVIIFYLTYVEEIKYEPTFWNSVVDGLRPVCCLLFSLHGSAAEATWVKWRPSGCRDTELLSLIMLWEHWSFVFLIHFILFSLAFSHGYWLIFCIQFSFYNMYQFVLLNMLLISKPPLAHPKSVFYFTIQSYSSIAHN